MIFLLNNIYFSTINLIKIIEITNELAPSNISVIKL
jgi:hypothetical protein